MTWRSVWAWMGFVVLMVVAEACHAQEAVAEAPGRLTPEHPRLFFRKADLPRIRQTIDALPEAKAQWESLQKTDPAKPVTFPTPPKPIQPNWAGVVNGEGQLAARCGFLYQMTGDERYAQRAKEMLLGYAQAFDTKVNFELCNDYQSTETGHAAKTGNTMAFYISGVLLTNAAAAYDCVYETLTPDERRTIENDLFHKFVAAIERFDYAQHQSHLAHDFMVNGGQWNGANLCNMGLAAVGFVLDDPRLYERGVRAFKLHLGRDMLADGFWVEEDRAYADTCMTSLFNIAWMARSSGYRENLFKTVVTAKPAQEYDPRYMTAPPVREDGAKGGPRSLQMYLDAHLDYQYPNFAGGNWGWYPGRNSISDSVELVGMYTLGYAMYGRPEYAFALQNVDRNKVSADRINLSLGAGITSLLYFGTATPAVAPVDTHSRVYTHGRWAVLKSIEGPDYWNSDSLYAFMPYGTDRNKSLQPLTLDIFGFGKVLAPRVSLKNHAQLLTGEYQLTEPAWNGLMTDGCNTSFFRDEAERSWMAWQELGELVKIVSPRIHYLGTRRSELYQPDIERHPEEDRTIGRTLALTDRYLVDVTHVVYDQPPKYKHNFDYVQHGYGKLTIEGSNDRFSDTTAVWTQDDGVGLRSTILSGKPRGGTKITTYARETTEFVIARRLGLDQTFIVVHEPVKGASRLAKVERLADEADHVALAVTHTDGTVDFLALRVRDSAAVYRFPLSQDRVEELKGNYLFVRTHPDGTMARQGG